MLLRTHQSTNRFPGGIGLKGNIHVSDDTRLFTGTVPFVWSCDVYLQELIETVPAWYITVHITAQGSTTRIFKSETVEIQPDRICTVPFEPGSVQESDDTGQYSMVECQVSGIGGISNCMYVKMSLDGGEPSIEIVGTEIQTDWIIGARDIVLTDPPVLQPDRKKSIAEIVVAV